MTKLADSFDLTGSQLNALCMFESDTPVPMKYLSTLLTCDASNVTGIIDRLEASQLIKREDSPTDRRVKMISLTQKGTHLRELAISHIKDISPEGITNLTAAEKLQLATLLTKAASCNK